MTCKPGIPREDERALIEIVQKATRGEVQRAVGDKAFEQLVAAHSGIIWREVGRYIGKGVDRDDLYQAALMGFWRGICSFDLTRRTRLTTFAKHWIFERVSKLHGKTRLPIYLPAHVRTKARRDDRAGGSALSALVQHLRHVESLDAPAHAHDGRDTVGDRLPDPRGSFEAALLDGDHRGRLRDLIEQALANMKPRHAELLRRRLLNDESETLEDIAATWGLTRERVRQIERDAMRAFRGWVMRNLGSEERALLGAVDRTPLSRSRHRRSRFRGVSWHQYGKRWSVDVTVDGRARYIGIFRDEEEAARAYDEAARRLLGDKAKLNFPDAVPAPATEAQAA